MTALITTAVDLMLASWIVQVIAGGAVALYGFRCRSFRRTRRRRDIRLDEGFGMLSEPAADA